MMYNSYESPTSLGIAERWERVLCYALGWISGLVMLIVERENRNVRRHATQSMLVFGGISLLLLAVSIVGGLFGAIPLIGWLFAALFWLVGHAIWIAAGILWLVLLVMAYARPNFFLPLGRTFARLTS